MSDEKLVEPFRVAFRAEGEFVNAYFAAPDTMEDAILLASVRESALDNTPGAFKEYQALVQGIVATQVRNLGLGEYAGYRTRPAPPHERSAESRKNDPPGSSLRVDVPEDVKNTMQEMAQKTGDALPPGWGFGLFIFTFGEGGTMAWTSSARRVDMIKTLQEWIRTEGD